jgi:hypothetical protein
MLPPSEKRERSAAGIDQPAVPISTGRPSGNLTRVLSWVAYSVRARIEPHFEFIETVGKISIDQA